MSLYSARWWSDKYIYALLLVFPLFVGFRGYTQTTVSKFALFAALTVAFLVFSSYALIKARGDELKKPHRGLALPMAGYVFFCLLSALCSPYGSAVLIGAGRFDGLLSTLLCAAAFFGTALLARTKAAYLYAAMTAGALCCAVGVMQLFGLNPLGLFPGGYDYYDAGIKFTGSFFGTIGNSDLVSAYLCLLLPAGAVFYITGEKRPLWLLAVLAVLSFSLRACMVSAGLLACAVIALLLPAVLVSDGKRLRRLLECGAVMAAALCLAMCFRGEKTGEAVRLWLSFSGKAAAMLILAAFCTIARLVFSKSEFKSSTLRIFFACLSGTAALSALAVIYFFPPESGTLWELSEVLRGNIDGSFGSSRILIWQEILEILPGRLLLGGGPGTLALSIDIDFSRYVPQTGETLEVFIDNAHNEYLGMLANTGLLSLLCYLAAQLASLVLALRCGSRAALCLIAGLSCYWIQDFFGLGLVLVSPLMWLCWGLLAAELSTQTKKASG